MKSFAYFKDTIKQLTAPHDFEKHHHTIEHISINHYDTFLWLLKQGTQIVPAIEAASRIHSMSNETGLPVEKITNLSNFFRMIHGIIDEADPGPQPLNQNEFPRQLLSTALTKLNYKQLADLAMNILVRLPPKHQQNFIKAAKQLNPKIPKP